MSDAILVAIITGGLSLLGIIYSSGKSASKVDANWTSSRRSSKPS